MDKAIKIIKDRVNRLRNEYLLDDCSSNLDDRIAELLYILGLLTSEKDKK